MILCNYALYKHIEYLEDEEDKGCCDVSNNQSNNLNIRKIEKSVDTSLSKITDDLLQDVKM